MREKGGNKEFSLRLEKRAGVLLLSLVLAGLVVGHWRFAAGAALGGVLSLLGFRCLKGVVNHVLSLPSFKARGKVVLYHYLRVAWVGSMVGTAFWLGVADPLGVLLGLSVLVINLLVSAVVDLGKIDAEV